MRKKHSLWSHASPLDLRSGAGENHGRQRQIEDPVGLIVILLGLADEPIELVVIGIGVIGAAEVLVQRPELVVELLLFGSDCDVGRNSVPYFRDRVMTSGVTEDLRFGR